MSKEWGLGRSTHTGDRKPQNTASKVGSECPGTIGLLYCLEFLSSKVQRLFPACLTEFSFSFFAYMDKRLFQPLFSIQDIRCVNPAKTCSPARRFAVRFDFYDFSIFYCQNNFTVSLTDTTGCFYLHKIPPEKLLIKIIEYPWEKSICIDFTDKREKEDR